MKVSGPVFATKATLNGRNYYLFSDRHNSTTGSCSGSCSDVSFDGRLTDGVDNCKTIVRCIYDFIRQGGDIYLEAPYVTRDSQKPSSLSIKTDYIDRIVYIFHDNLLRKKKCSLGKMHYVDIRERFEGTYNENGTRQMISANPFSGSVATRHITTVGTQGFRESQRFLRFVLDHAWDIFEYYCGHGLMPLPNEEGAIFDEYRERILRVPESYYRGVRLSRVAKQLRKLPSSLAIKIEDWARQRFTEELAVSEHLFSLFQPTLKFEDLRTWPISCLVSLSSVIMDIYSLSRCFYQSRGNVLFYCGAAHIENYVGFFTLLGATVDEPSLPTHERCLLLGKMDI